MLLKLLFFRLGPLVPFGFFRERKQMKFASKLLLAIYLICLFVAAWKVFGQEKWLGIIYLPVSMFPHYIFYAFSVWMIIRCIWQAWSERVWKRIYYLSILGIILGILTENYWNPKILQFFFGIFK